MYYCNNKLLIWHNSKKKTQNNPPPQISPAAGWQEPVILPVHFRILPARKPVARPGPLSWRLVVVLSCCALTYLLLLRETGQLACRRPTPVGAQTSRSLLLLPHVDQPLQCGVRPPWRFEGQHRAAVSERLHVREGRPVPRDLALDGGFRLRTGTSRRNEKRLCYISCVDR